MNLVRTDERKRSEPWPGARVDFVATADVPSVRVARIGAGEPLLLINGLGANLEMWQPLVRELSCARELIAFDLPGTGRSARPRWPLRMPQLARLVIELLDELGHEQLDVLGYSLGGIVAPTSRWLCRATGIRWCRWPTAAIWPTRSPTGDCTS